MFLSFRGQTDDLSLIDHEHGVQLCTVMGRALFMGKIFALIMSMSSLIITARNHPSTQMLLVLLLFS
jgi:hypothetical protein